MARPLTTRRKCRLRLFGVTLPLPPQSNPLDFFWTGSWIGWFNQNLTKRDCVALMDAKLAFVFVVKIFENDSSHGTLLVVDRTRPDRHINVYFDSDPRDDEDPLEYVKETIFDGTPLFSKSCEWLLAEAPCQDYDSNDCLPFSCSFAFAYSRALSTLLNSPQAATQSISKVVVKHTMSEVDLGQGLRRHIFDSVRQEELIPNEASLDLKVEFL